MADDMTTDIDEGPVPGQASFGILGLVALASASLLASLGISIASVALPTLAKFFSASIADVQWVVLAYLISVTATVVMAGWFGDLYGHRRVLTAGFGIFAVSSAACAMAPTLGLLVAARLIQGVAGAILMALPLSIARDLVPKDRLGSAMGLFGTMSAIGTALGPSVGGLMIAGFGWQSAFAVSAILAVAMTGLSLVAIPRRIGQSDTRRASFDMMGAGLLTTGLLAYALAVTGRGGEASWGAAIAALAAFALVEKRAAFPLIPLAAFRDTRTATGLVMNLLVAAIMMSTLVVGPFFLSFGLGLNVAAVGVVMAVGPVVSAFSGLPAGRMTDRFGTHRVLLAGLVIIGLALIAFAVLPRLLGVAGYVAALAMLTPGFQLFLASNNTATMMAAPENRRGVMSGLLGLSRNIGFMTGASAMAALFATAAGSSEVGALSADAVSGAFMLTFLFAAGLIPVALALALLGHRGEKDLMQKI